MTQKDDLLTYLDDVFVREETITVAGQDAKITALSKEIDYSDVLTIRIEVRPLRPIKRPL